MAEAEAINDDPGIEAAKPPRFGKKKLIIAGICLLLAAGGGTTWFLMSRNDAPEAAAKGETSAAAEGEDAAEVFVEVPAMVVNLRSADGAPRLIKLSLMLVPVAAADAPKITARLPLVIDSFQPFLRELRPEDLAGSAAVFRIKEELLVRANDVVGVGTVKDVLIQDLIQQ